ncbi:hypothetical protein V3G39_06560 [Dermatophilaceae bacterium Sec6.4]
MPRRLPAVLVAFLCGAASLLAMTPSQAQPTSTAALSLSALPGSAQTLAPGMYSGELAAAGPGYAKVTRAVADTITVSLITAPAVSGGDPSASLTLQLPDGTSCAASGTSPSRIDRSSGLRSAVVTLAGLPAVPGAATVPAACGSATTLLIVVQVTAPAGAGAQLGITREPPINGAPSPAAVGIEQTPPLAPSLDITGAPVNGDRPYASATTLTQGSYSLDLRPQRLQTFRVRVGWGQQIGVSLEAPRDATTFVPSSNTMIGLTLWSPQLVPINPAAVNSIPDTITLPADNGTPQRIASGSAQVSWSNRVNPAVAPASNLSPEALTWTSVAGWYYVTIRSTPSPPTGGATTTAQQQIVPTRLNVAVTGIAVSGPTYVDAAGNTISASKPTAQQAPTPSSSTPWWRISASAGILLLTAAAMAWAVRRRRSQSAVQR